MFKVRHIYYFKAFHFNNDTPPKEKYFIVLKIMEDALILGCLPTRTNKVPSFATTEHGCNNIEERMYNCYAFKKDQKICLNDFSFDMPTFIYGGDVDYYEMQRLTDEHPVENKDYREMGELTEEEFKAIINCFLNSNSVKRGIQRKLAT